MGGIPTSSRGSKDLKIVDAMESQFVDWQPRPPHVCPRCNGDGYVMNRGQQVALGILTLGMAPLMDAAMSNGPRDSLMSKKCNVCNGSGVVR